VPPGVLSSRRCGGGRRERGGGTGARWCGARLGRHWRGALCFASLVGWLRAGFIFYSYFLLGAVVVARRSVGQSAPVKKKASDSAAAGREGRRGAGVLRLN
jgi:hypothetical protein